MVSSRWECSVHGTTHKQGTKLERTSEHRQIRNMATLSSICSYSTFKLFAIPFHARRSPGAHFANAKRETKTKCGKIRRCHKSESEKERGKTKDERYSRSGLVLVVSMRIVVFVRCVRLSFEFNFNATLDSHDSCSFRCLCKYFEQNFSCEQRRKARLSGNGEEVLQAANCTFRLKPRGLFFCIQPGRTKWLTFLYITYRTSAVWRETQNIPRTQFISRDADDEIRLAAIKITRDISASCFQSEYFLLFCSLLFPHICWRGCFRVVSSR